MLATDNFQLLDAKMAELEKEADDGWEGKVGSLIYLKFIYFKFIYLKFIYLKFTYLKFTYLKFIHLKFIYINFIYLKFIYCVKYFIVPVHLPAHLLRSDFFIECDFWVHSL